MLPVLQRRKTKHRENKSTAEVTVIAAKSSSESPSLLSSVSKLLCSIWPETTPQCRAHPIYRDNGKKGKGFSFISQKKRLKCLRVGQGAGCSSYPVSKADNIQKVSGFILFYQTGKPRVSVTV